MQSKRGQGLSTNAIILIILGVVILVILILGFTMGWNTILPWIGGGDNVDTIVQQCSIACSTQSAYDFCAKERTLRVDDEEMLSTCYMFATEPEYAAYGIAECPGLSCEAPEE